MKRIYLYVTIILLPFLSTAQSKIQSLLYDDQERFRIDTTLSISASQYEVWKIAEPKIFELFHTRIRENLKREIKSKKILKRNIVSFVCDANGITNIETVEPPGNPPNKYPKNPENMVKSYCKEIFNEIKQAAAKCADNPDFSGKYYISL